MGEQQNFGAKKFMKKQGLASTTFGINRSV
jgi:hypothetical protein